MTSIWRPIQTERREHRSTAVAGRADDIDDSLPVSLPVIRVSAKVHVVVLFPGMLKGEDRSEEGENTAAWIGIARHKRCTS